MIRQSYGGQMASLYPWLLVQMVPEGPLALEGDTGIPEYEAAEKTCGILPYFF
jgi:hypothetical protein